MRHLHMIAIAALTTAASFPCRSAPPAADISAPSASAPVASPSAPRIASASTGVSVTFAGGDGTSFDSAVVVNATSEVSGVRAEYAWLKEHFPSYKRTSQALVHNAGKSYDILEIEPPAGGKMKLYFDISAFYGKL